MEKQPAKPELKRLWNNEDFIVEKYVLQPKTSIAGSDLGHGIVYYPGSREVKHRCAGSGDAEQMVLGGNRPDFKCVWNDALDSEIVNDSAAPANLFRIQLAHGSKLGNEWMAGSDPQNATAYLLRPEWPDAFNASVRQDLQAIGSLAEPFVGHPIAEIPAVAIALPKDRILRAKRAKEDLEFKIAWFNAALRKSGVSPFKSVRVQDWVGGWATGDAGGGDGGWARTDAGAAPPDGNIEVTVNTKFRGADVPNYEVWINPYGAGDDRTDAERFPKFSTPTKKRIVVGKYSMWAEKDGMSSQTTVINVGSLELPLETEQEFDLAV